MGLNIGIEVKKQKEAYGEYGFNPKGNIKEIETDFFQFLNDKFPNGGFSLGWVSLNNDNYYDFDVRMFGYGEKFGFDNSIMYLAIAEYVFNHFSHAYGIEMKAYWSG